MRRLWFILSLCLLLLLNAVAALADDPNPSAIPALNVSASNTPASVSIKPTSQITPSSTKPQIIADEKTNTVRVLIGGKEILTIGAQGLHLNGNFEYAGQIHQLHTNPIHGAPKPVWSAPPLSPVANPAANKDVNH